MSYVVKLSVVSARIRVCAWRSARKWKILAAPCPTGRVGIPNDPTHDALELHRTATYFCVQIVIDANLGTLLTCIESASASLESIWPLPDLSSLLGVQLDPLKPGNCAVLGLRTCAHAVVFCRVYLLLGVDASC